MPIAMLQKPLIAVLATCVLMLTPSFAEAHSGHLNEKAVSVCHDKARSDDCQFEGGHQDLYIGSCQYMSDTLMCVRNQPIQKLPTKKIESETVNKD
ncbi:hypothetical protein [Shewanella litoralis]|uniref:DUF3551 domain-containing protein n=1 Tax=Shewanella litoralis TaxID=2282700 RepID=A0ABQ2RAV8_9GAMM|nr:hypothetical protein [Shewanella litoralis]GGQ17315.1 hypothetical protein GCM10009411_17130 [Shewanella litoralis]